MMDFRRVDIAKQKAYDLLRDWIKLVARHTNPDQDISELLGWLWKLKPATPDPDTGLVPCGCGGKATRSYSSIGCVVFCASCGLSTKNTFFASEAVNAWNVAMGYKGGAE